MDGRYSSNDILGMGSSWDVTEFTRRQTEYCGTRWSLTKDRWARKLYPKADFNRLRSLRPRPTFMGPCLLGQRLVQESVLQRGLGRRRPPRGLHVPKEESAVSPCANAPRPGGAVPFCLTGGRDVGLVQVQWTLGAILYKLRYFPLREVQRLRDEAALEHRHGAGAAEGGGVLPTSTLAQALLLACIAVVAALAARFLAALHKGADPSHISPPLLPAAFTSTLHRSTSSLWDGLKRSRKHSGPSPPRRSSSATRLASRIEEHSLNYVY